MSDVTDVVGAVEAGGTSAVPAIPDTGKSARAQAYNELLQLAKLTTNTTMIPKPLRGRPDEAFAVMVYGAELGLEPFAALRSIYIVDGQPTCSAGLMRGLIQSAGHVLQWRHVAADRVVLYGRRRDTGADAQVEWTLEDARRAKLAGKGNWSTYPRAMLAARATSELARLLFADVLHGISYTPEEVGAVGPYSAIDVDYDPGRHVDYETGEITDDTRPDVVDRIEQDTDDESAAMFDRLDTLLEEEP
jgi:hypothetical protein